MITDHNQTTVEENPKAEQPTTPETAPETPEMAMPSPEPIAPEAEAPVAPVPDVPAPVAETAPEQPAVPTEPVEPTAPVEQPVAAVEKPAPTPVEPQGPRNVEDDMKLFEQAMNAMEMGEEADSGEGYKKLSKGDRIEATVIQVDKDRLFVDLGTKSEGIVPLSELSEGSIESAQDHFKVGDKINVIVKQLGGAEGNPIVSKRLADFEETWDAIERNHRDGTMVTAQVVDRVKGGLVVDIGVRGFVPATHVGSGKLRNIEKYVGQPLQLKIIEIDRERKKVVLSNRQAEELRRAEAKENIFKSIKPGDTLDGTVRRLTDYGAFVDLGGVDGLLHISEMSWMRINHPKEIFKEGQDIKVMVLRLDEGAGKISLGHRQVLPDPWNLIKQNYTVGQKMNVTINRIVQSGAFVKLAEGAEAFLPVSEMSHRRIKRPEDVIEVGQEVEVQVIDLRTEERRMVLSMRATGNLPAEDRGGSYDMPMEYGGGDDRGGDKRGGAKKKGGKKGGRGGRDYEDDFEDVGRRGYATGGATIGERLGMLKGFLGRDEDDEDLETETETESTEAESTETAETTEE